MKRASLLLVAALGACSREPAPVASSSGEVASATEALARMDGRSPVPLLPTMANHQKENMRDHLVAVQEIVTAVASEDFAGVERAAGRIGFSQTMGRMCTHMGAGAPGFTEQALDFHHTADRIAEAARDRDRDRVLTELGATLQRCTGCHAMWKQEIVDETTWQRVTSSAPPAHGAPH
jgi:hypothetical protein